MRGKGETKQQTCDMNFLEKCPNVSSLVVFSICKEDTMNLILQSEASLACPKTKY